VAAEARQSEVGPVGTLDTVHILVVLNSIKSVLESIGVEQGVQGVSAGREHTSRSLRHTRVLLLGQVVVVLGDRELLVAIAGFVLAGDKLLLQVFDFTLHRTLE
jgi:hypothetical protein